MTTITFPAAMAVPLALALLMIRSNPYAQTMIQAVEEVTRDTEEEEQAED